MKKILIRTSLVLLLVFGMAYNAYAIPITGGISFAGAVTPDNNDLTLAQQLTFSSQSFVTTAVGSYAGKAGTSVTVASPQGAPVAGGGAGGGGRAEAASPASRVRPASRIRRHPAAEQEAQA